MAAKLITIPEDLLQLKPSSALESVAVSKLARKGTALLRQLTDTSQAVAVNIQGYGSMVTLSQQQYDEIKPYVAGLVGYLNRAAKSREQWVVAHRKLMELKAKLSVIIARLKT